MRALDPNDPEFADVRADLARLFIAHKADLGMANQPDADIARNVNTIAAALMQLGVHALEHNDTAWLERHQWFAEASEHMFAGHHGAPLDG